MQVSYTKEFLKNYKRRIKTFNKLNQQFLNRIGIFKTDRASPILKDHQLGGNKSEYRAFSITGDIRVVYKQIGNEMRFFDIGTHNQVY